MVNLLGEHGRGQVVGVHALTVDLDAVVQGVLPEVPLYVLAKLRGDDLLPRLLDLPLEVFRVLDLDVAAWCPGSGLFGQSAPGSPACIRTTMHRMHHAAAAADFKILNTSARAGCIIQGYARICYNIVNYIVIYFTL